MTTYIYSVYICYAILVVARSEVVDNSGLPECGEGDFHFDYTTCDSEGGRWRVSVPKLDNYCVGGRPQAPVRGQECDFTCGPGYYLDINTDQKCHPCAAGYYSLGGGVSYDDWTGIPLGFSSHSESFSSKFESNDVRLPCNEIGWTPSGKYIATNNTDCVASLVYSANLVRDGSVTFSYRFIDSDDDIRFLFEIQNGQCSARSDEPKQEFLKQTDDEGWLEQTAHLKAGQNILKWRVFSLLGLSIRGSRGQRFTAIESIKVTGVAYTSNCTMCDAGTYSTKGSSACDECPENTYSKRGAQECMPCDETTQFSGSGADECIQKPECTSSHYIEYNTECIDGNTRKNYKWIEPKLCLGGVDLPSYGQLESCPPCNVGMQLLNGSCQFCKPNEYSDGINKCVACPGSTAPETSVVYKRWSSLPADANLTTHCMSLHSSDDEQECVTRDGWAFFDGYVQTVQINGAHAYLILSLEIGGFQANGANAELSFLFDLDCAGDCSLILFMQVGSAKTHTVTFFEGEQQQTAFRLPIYTEERVKFIWAFSKSDSRHFNNRQDHAKIYLIKVTNTLNGGAEKCKACPQGADNDGCIPCQPGHYIDPVGPTCKPCPSGKVVPSQSAWGIDSCVSCPPGLVPYKGQECISDCTYSTTSGKHYDFHMLARPNTVEGPRLFTPSGHAYFHMFNFTLCGKKEEHELAYCNKNISSSEEFQWSSKLEPAVTARVCQNTILLPRGPSESIVSISPVSLGSRITGATNVADVNMTKLLTEAGFLQPTPRDSNGTGDIYMKYSSETPTAACLQGRTVTVVLRCDASVQQHRVELPRSCGDGTCDGCNFMFLISSVFACPVCTAADIEKYTTTCVNETQSIITRTKVPCNIQGTSFRLSQESKKCSEFWQDQWPMWLKIVLISVPVIFFCGIILLTVVVLCWIKNRNLKYKYMKLIESSSDKYSEMPAPETCALDEGEEEEHFDLVKVRKGKKFFSKFKLLQNKSAIKENDDDEDDDDFESMQMTKNSSRM